MIPELGTLAMVIALLLSAAQAFFGLVGAHRNRQPQVGRAAAHVEFHRGPGALADDRAEVRELGDALAIDREDLVAGLEPGRGGRPALDRAPDDDRDVRVDEAEAQPLGPGAGLGQRATALHRHLDHQRRDDVPAAHLQVDAAGVVAAGVVAGVVVGVVVGAVTVRTSSNPDIDA